VRRFRPASIDVLGTWQGTLLYGLLTLGLIYAVNLQQQRLAARGLLSTRPIPPLADDAAANAEDSEELLLKSFPDLRPLHQAAAGRALQRLQAETRQDRSDLFLGSLRLQLDVPTFVELRSAGEAQTTLPEARGVLTLPVMPPFRLRLSPAPKEAAAVRWNGRTLVPTTRSGPTAQPGERRSADYRYPAAAAPRAASRAEGSGSGATPPRP
jgi:hypothetical protein